MDMLKKFYYTIIMILLLSQIGYSMHIAEGILSLNWVLLWIVFALPFVVWSLIIVINNLKSKPNYIAVLALIGALVFLITSLAIPSPVAGSVSHPAATGISSIILGPIVSVFLGFITLLIQALFMGHGGITSLGANVFSMAVVGSFVAFGLYKLSRLIKLPYIVAGFIAGFSADISTYLTTALQLALEFHGNETLLNVWMTLFGMFLPIQLPVSIVEGIVAGVIINMFINRAKEYIDPIVESK
ncbi:MAG: energy-coupling factor ABC transporter permease [Brevinematales bacterium]|nr:energy-coupling factor ABC transporter permease [Brevinematales bacterium]